MKIKHIILIALTALALGLEGLAIADAIGGHHTTVPCGCGGMSGDVHAGDAAPAIAGSNTIRMGQETN